jgi:tetratricopeptide (TPR) repeat protein
MGRAGLARVVAELNVETQARRYLDLYRELCLESRVDSGGAGATRPAAQPEPPGPTEPEIPVEVLDLAQTARLEPDHRDRRETLARAFALRDAGQATQGRVALEELALRLPEDLEVRQTLGGLLAAEGRAAEAVACFRQCLARQPWQYDFLLNASDAWRYAGRFEEALAALDEIEAASPHHRGLWLKRGQALAASGRVREAIRALLREVRTHRCPRALGLLREILPQRHTRSAQNP